MCTRKYANLDQVYNNLIEVNSNETLFYLFTVSFKRCAESCNSIDDLYARVGVSNKIKEYEFKRV